MPARFVAIGIVLLLAAACGRTEFVSPLASPLATVPSPLATPTPQPVPMAMPNGIASPIYGSVVQGQVEIIGTATHPEFGHYELFFSPCPVSGVQWCSIRDAAFQPVQNGVLGIWNTITIPNGTYQIQLRVVRRDGNYETFIVNGITVANAPNLTATPQPTWTPSPTFTPTLLPTIVPPIHTPVAGQLPRMTYDLLFLGKYSLMRWNHRTGQIETLVAPDIQGERNWGRNQKVAWMAGPGSPDGSVSSFSVSADGQKIALRRISGSTASEIDLFEMSTRQTTPLVQAPGQDLVHVSISPDGQWVAYIQVGSFPSVPTILTPPGGYRTGLALSPAIPVGGGTSAGMIYAVRTDAPDRRIEVGYCAEERTEEHWWECSGFVWSPDSRSIAWNDGRGVWVAELGQPARQLVSNSIGMPPSSGGGVYQAHAWSPLGRYLLARVGHWEGSSQGVIDTQTGNLARIPDTFELPFPGPRVAWMQDGRLFILRPADPRTGSELSAEIWRVDGDHEPMLNREIEFLPGIGLGNYGVAPTQLMDGRLAFGVVNGSPTNYRDRGLYFVDLNELVPRKVNGLPPVEERGDMGWSTIGMVNVYWSPDGSGAIFEDLGFDPTNRPLLYVPTDGSPLIDLRPVMDEGDLLACCFVWTR
jgi:hypothetical protein